MKSLQMIQIIRKAIRMCPASAPEKGEIRDEISHMN